MSWQEQQGMKVMSFEYWVLREAELTSWFSILRTHISQLSYKNQHTIPANTRQIDF
jgi:hypothetical protein